MADLHEALACLRPIDYSAVPIDDLQPYLSKILANAELVANSIPPPPGGQPYGSAQRTRTESEPAQDAAGLTISEVRPPPPAQEYEKLRKSWGKTVKLGNKEAATGMVVHKMAGNDRHGAWFARSVIYEGLGFAKWKAALQREFPQSLEVQEGPGEGSVRGIGGDRRLEDIDIPEVAKLEVYQLSAQFPGPTSPREFITLLITSDTCSTEASKVGDTIPRHFMVVSIPVTHADAPPRNGMIRGFYESIEMIREIPMPALNDTNKPDAELNPVEWLMVTRSDPGGGIPRFMVERSVPSSIVQDAVKFLDWACARDEKTGVDQPTNDEETAHHHLSVTESNGITAGIGTSIADRPSSALRRLSSRTEQKSAQSSRGLLDQLQTSMGAYLPHALNPLQRRESSSSSSTASSVVSFASAEQFNTAPDGLSPDGKAPAPSTTSRHSLRTPLEDSSHAREIQKIEQKKQQLLAKLDQTQEKQAKELENESQKTQKEIEKATERHDKERKKQEDKFQREIRKLEERRDKETKKLVARQQKEAGKNQLLKAQRERDEFKQKAELFEQENKVLHEKISELQQQNTVLVASVGKSETGRDILKSMTEDHLVDRSRTSSRGSPCSDRSGRKSKSSIEVANVP